MLSHHQLFSHVGELNSDKYGDSCANPNLYKNFSPYFNKIAAWYWGHEHSFALYNEGAFGLNQGRLIGSSSYEQATTDNPYADNYSLVPFSTKNKQLPPNDGYKDDDDADFYYPHVGAIITLRENNNPLIEYYQYPSWKNGHAPQNPQLTKIVDEIISNPTKTPTGIWKSNKKIEDANFKSEKAPAICLYDSIVYTVYTNPNDNDHLWWTTLIYKDNKLDKTTTEKIPSNTFSTEFDKNNDKDSPSSKTNPVMSEFGEILYLVYTDKSSGSLYWLTYDLKKNVWTKMGQLICGNNQVISTTKSPTLVMHSDKLILYYLTDEGIVKSAFYQTEHWEFEDEVRFPPQSTKNTPFCPAAVSLRINGKKCLFMVYANTSNNRLSLLRLDNYNTWHDLGFINYGSQENYLTTKRHVSICTDDKFIKMLYITDDNSVNWATMDLGFYNEQDYVCLL